MADFSHNGRDRLKVQTSGRCKALTVRAVLIGLATAILLNLWLHYAELVLSAYRGHTALANTSIPFGAFSALFVFVLINLFVTRILPAAALSPGELIVIYTMCTVATVLSSSGGLHFLIPTLTAAHYFATEANGWANLFHPYIPKWLAQTDRTALEHFYKGNAPFIWSEWKTQILVWMGFLFVFACSTLCICVILRKQWIERERLPFPTVALPLELIREGVPLFKDRLFWGGAIATFLLGTLNTIHQNIPNMPLIEVRSTEIGSYFQNPPWTALAGTVVTFFPFAIGIGFLLSTEVAFSCWFFYLMTRAELVFAQAIRATEGVAYGVQSTFPYLSYQGAGAFLGISIAALWLARRHLITAFMDAFRTNGKSTDPDAGAHRAAFIGLGISYVLLVAFTVVAGARLSIALMMIFLVLLYLIAATRIRAETGNVWPVGPDVDGYRLLQTLFGSRFFSTADLTALTYVRAATAGQDFRGTCMPHQLDGLKISDAAGIDFRKLVVPILLSVAIGVTASFIIALTLWTKYGALAKTNYWRSYSGLNSFTVLAQFIRNPRPPDLYGLRGIGFGILFTMVLAFLRSRYVWWPFHPVGYAMANTWTMNYAWTPFFCAWLIKVIIIRAGGLRLYRRALPFFLGVIVGDILQGAFYTLLGCVTNINVYPANW